MPLRKSVEQRKEAFKILDERMTITRRTQSLIIDNSFEWISNLFYFVEGLL